MRTLIAALALFLPSVAWAGTSTIQAQLTLYPDLGLQYSGEFVACDTPFDLGDGSNGAVCVSFPGRIIGFAGTSTIKSDGVEVLAAVSCSGQTLWQGEHRNISTLPIQASGLRDANITGPCRLTLQYLTPRFSAGGYEMQFTIFHTK